MLQELFKKFNFDQHDYLIFTTLYKLGTNPASVIAKHAGVERTTTYRILKNLNKLGLVAITTRQGMQMFFVEDEKTILKFVQRQKNELGNMEENYPLIENELKSMKPQVFSIPKIKIYDRPGNLEGSKQIFDDILDEIKKQNLTTIRLIASDTFSEKVGSNKLQDIGDFFLNNLSKNEIKIDALIAEGMLTRERLSLAKNMTELFSLPAGNGASNIYIVGDTVFIIMFKETTIGLKISHPDIAQTLHFIFDQLQKKN